MGCTGSKAAGDDVAVADVYRPPPTSVSLFDISAVEEPWKKNKAAGDDEEEEETASSDDDDDDEEAEDEKPAAKTVVPVPLPVLDKLEGYELFAPASWSEVSKALEDMKPALDSSKVVQLPHDAPPKKKTKKKKTKKKQQPPPAPPELAGRRVVKDNPFLMRDRETKAAGGGCCCCSCGG